MTTARNTVYEYALKYNQKEAQINFNCNYGSNDFDTKLYRFGARDYDPTIGRWTTKDPSGFNGGAANLYEYARSNPINNIDPDGNIALPVIVGIGIFLHGSLVDTSGQAEWEKQRVTDIASFFLGGAIQGATVKSIPSKVTGYTKHGIERAIGDGNTRAGTCPREILNTVRNPIKVTQQSDGAFNFKGSNSTVVLTPDGRVITTYPRGIEGIR